MFIGGLNWETTDRMYPSLNTIITTSPVSDLLSYTRIAQRLLFDIRRSPRMHSHARWRQRALQGLRLSYLQRPEDRQRSNGERTLS